MRIKYLVNASIIFLLQSCLTLNEAMYNEKYKNSGVKVEVSDYSEIEEDDNITLVNGRFNFRTPFSDNLMFDLRMGVGATHYNGKLGTFDFNYNYSLFQKVGLSSYYPAKELIAGHSYGFTYSYPVIKLYNGDRALHLSATNQNNELYIVYTKTALINKVNLRLSYNSIYSMTFSHLRSFANYLYNENDLTMLDFDNLYSQIIQSNGSLDFGLSWQNIINTKFNAKDKDENTYKVNTSILTDVYFDICYLISNKSAETQFNYLASLNGGSTTSNDVSVSPDLYMKKRSFGFKLGIETTIKDYTKIFTTSYIYELGSLPGYFDKLKTSFYFKFGVRFGFSKWG